MHILVIFAHPLDDSYGAALRDITVEALKARGHVGVTRSLTGGSQ